MKLRPVLTDDQRRDALRDAACATGTVTTLRAANDAGKLTALTAAARDELLKKCMAGEYVELELELHAYEQQPGRTNRKNTRFRDGAMMALGRSGKGTPLMRDHDQGNALARGGTILSSETNKLAEGHYEIKQTVKLTATWAVELALRGLLDTLSIGWSATGPVHCSVCDTPVFEDCYHWRGDVVTNDETGESQVVEWVFTSADLVETSVVSVPAVPAAHIEAIRATLTASNDSRAIPAPRTSTMKLLASLLATLCLAPTAGEDEALSAVAALKTERDAAKAELAIATKELAIAAKENEILSGEKKKTSEDKFILEALGSGRIAVGDETQWRELHRLAPERATTLMAARPEGASTPVGLPRQSKDDATPAAADATPTGAGAASPELKTALAKEGVDADQVLEFATLFGVTDPANSLADAHGVKRATSAVPAKKGA